MPSNKKPSLQNNCQWAYIDTQRNENKNRHKFLIFLMLEFFLWIFCSK